MGLLIDGKWHDQWYNTRDTNGEFIREDSQFRRRISNTGDFRPESGRYHLYVSLACPWAHRTLIFRKLKCLEEHVTVSVVHPHMLENGWVFESSEQGTTDTVNNARFLYEIYMIARPDYSGRVTVPVLWDKREDTIVNNESSEIIRMFNSAFNELTGNMDDYYPAPLRDDIDSINSRVYENINNGVYRAGFATRQEAYERAYDRLFETLDEIEDRLSQQRYLTGKQLTEADWRLFTTLIRFDTVYYSHFKVNRQRIEDYPNLSNYLRELYQYPGIMDTVNFFHIKQHYFYSHHMINPARIVPKGPDIDYLRAHNRHEQDYGGN